MTIGGHIRSHVAPRPLDGLTEQEREDNDLPSQFRNSQHNWSCKCKQIGTLKQPHKVKTAKPEHDCCQAKSPREGFHVPCW